MARALGTKQFRSHILAWYKQYGRHDLPWRKTRDPYKILVSEVMLQQTQTDRVKEKYKLFLTKFPTVTSLARAPTRTVLAAWSGLGYNRRALYLHRATQKIARDFHGRFPQTPEMLEMLPGVGPYTARAVCAFAWNKPEIFIETNIRRVFIYFHFKNRARVPDSDILPMIARTLDHTNPRCWYWALMDYGAGALKEIPNPNRKSRHYTRQSRFEGSQRYARAKILQFVLAHPHGVLVADVIRFSFRDSLLPHSRTEISEIISQLAAEGFLRKIGRVWKA
ncbi:MAG: hypothetical protein A3G60_03455 [Candidatus Ryanbacteria bacterium RIFCSPLOWO2_12_FULL_47_9c]|uniref:Adenine DNA glycosylase n=1 Tax=Candidatus Ryanbacteria bacterium RIFCSPLOWO2_12_FULL_47_9c TaxID=1802131 RepID=A0A1G2H703_9BACT|nr:MAG: HhH-GPD family protein [Parcubacteria group bacterium GW2011_GWA2_47_10b]KKU86453.1 MAG: HhH-GPD family protein [Parcubacteria group bacterium GW2011_GWA1_47_9]OGZ47763.1 MAG: hypothetical protein A3C83_01670 [Candidatus Ryanbacteria bacterium RIFCSPHIGHO2_02_FULL_47_25]OGZ58080.1 MAG: hypothetical protein A3G60_03455 [Candidatus Ryanbacteria bacterium RIFCSPLOWO2_12_FULL_47_9c]